MNSNKIVKFNYNKNLIHCYRTPKKYEENLKKEIWIQQMIINIKQSLAENA